MHTIGQCNKNQLPKAPKGMTWTSVRMTADSGACEHVMAPKHIPKGLRDNGAVKPTTATNHITYGSASGHPLPNLGKFSSKGLPVR